MIQNILFIDKNKGFPLFLQKILSEVDPELSFLTAEKAAIAIDMLERNIISLIVIDIQICEENDFNLLTYIVKLYPDIPVVTTSNAAAPEKEKLARAKGAVKCISKGLSPVKISKIIQLVLARESDGGVLHGVTIGMFLQIMEMEKKTATIRVQGNSPRKQGVLFFRDGEFLDARCNGLRTESAAHVIFSWDEVSISIQIACPLNKKMMNGDLKAILFEAMRLKDEANPEDYISENYSNDKAPDNPLPLHDKGENLSSTIVNIQQKIAKEMGVNGELVNINSTGSWENLASEITKIGAFFDIGPLKGGYLDMGGENCFVLLPDKKMKVVPANPLCSRDRIMQILSNQ